MTGLNAGQLAKHTSNGSLSKWPTACQSGAIEIDAYIFNPITIMYKDIQESF